MPATANSLIVSLHITMHFFERIASKADFDTIAHSFFIYFLIIVVKSICCFVVVNSVWRNSFLASHKYLHVNCDWSIEEDCEWVSDCVRAVGLVLCVVHLSWIHARLFYCLADLRTLVDFCANIEHSHNGNNNIFKFRGREKSSCFWYWNVWTAKRKNNSCRRKRAAQMWWVAWEWERCMITDWVFGANSSMIFECG